MTNPDVIRYIIIILRNHGCSRRANIKNQRIESYVQDDSQ